LFAGRALLVSTKLPLDFRAFDLLSISTGSRAKRSNQHLPINPAYCDGYGVRAEGMTAGMKRRFEDRLQDLEDRLSNHPIRLLFLANQACRSRWLWRRR
jgi:hypothetical protein